MDRIWMAKVILERLRAAAESARAIAARDLALRDHVSAGDWHELASSIEKLISSDSGEVGLEALIRRLEKGVKQ